MKNLKKEYIYPILIIVFAIILSLLKLNGSSVGTYHSLFYPNQDDPALVFGVPRAIRSDEYLLGTPILLSQDINHEPTINNDIGKGTNLGTSHNVPTRDIFTFFEPASWSFLFTDDTEFSFAAYWWIRIAIMLIGTYLLFLELTKKNILLSISGSLLFLVTPFIQWWLSADPMAPIGLISFGMYFFIKLINSKKILYSVIFSLLLAYTIIAFGLILYPPFQIPLAWFAIFLAIGILIKNRKKIFKDKKNLLRILLSLVLAIAIVITFAFIFYTSFKDVISVTMNTVYPGARFFPAGLGSKYSLFNGFYNILMQKDSNGAPFGNQCEASNFLLLYIPVLIWFVYKNILYFKNKKSIDWIGLSISVPLVLFTLWYLFPLPDFISRYTGLYMVLPQRLYLGIGFISYIFIIYILSNSMYKIKNKKILDWIIAVILSICTGIFYYSIGKHLSSINPNSFLVPTFLSTTIKILLVTLLTSFLAFTLLKGYKKIFLATILSFGFISTIFINPLYKGLDILKETELAQYIKETSEKDDSKWIVYGNHTLAQYALANNASVVNGIHLYPQFKIWEILDPEEKYTNIYNRYAHVVVSDYSGDPNFINLIAMDTLVVNIDPCDPKIKELKVKYILSTENFEKECLIQKKSFDNDDILIYELN